MAERKAVQIMEYVENNGIREFKINFDVIGNILLHDKVKNRKIVVLSIIGEYRKGKSFFLGYCLRFLYANVSTFL